MACIKVTEVLIKNAFIGLSKMNKCQLKINQMLESSDINLKATLTIFYDIRVKTLEMNGKIYFSREIKTAKENQIETQYLN